MLYCPELTLQRDWNNKHKTGKDGHHPLHEVQKALKLPETNTFGDTLDAIFISILENLNVIHELNIVHRDCEFPMSLMHFYMFSRLLANIYAILHKHS